MTSALVLSKPRFHVSRRNPPATIAQFVDEAVIDRIEKMLEHYESARLDHDVEACRTIWREFNDFVRS